MNTFQTAATRWIPAAMLTLAPLAALSDTDTTITLQGTAEVPPVTTMASGSGSIAVMPDRGVSGHIRISGVAATMAHIHEGAAGKNGPVIIPLNKAADDRFEVPPGARLTEAQYASYKAGRLYVNVHSAAHPGGEIRAQLMHAPLQPAEPAAPMRYGY